MVGDYDECPKCGNPLVDIDHEQVRHDAEKKRTDDAWEARMRDYEQRRTARIIERNPQWAKRDDEDSKDYARRMLRQAIKMGYRPRGRDT